MKLKNLIQAPPNETYIKNSSPLVTALLMWREFYITRLKVTVRLSR